MEGSFRYPQTKFPFFAKIYFYFEYAKVAYAAPPLSDPCYSIYISRQYQLQVCTPLPPEPTAEVYNSPCSTSGRRTTASAAS